jgi:hypothetical protein
LTFAPHADLDEEFAPQGRIPRKVLAIAAPRRRLDDLCAEFVVGDPHC